MSDMLRRIVRNCRIAEFSLMTGWGDNVNLAFYAISQFRNSHKFIGHQKPNNEGL
jgi:hypothetical protein